MPPAIAGTLTIAGTCAIARKLRTGMNGPVMGTCAPNLSSNSLLLAARDEFEFDLASLIRMKPAEIMQIF